MTEHHLHSVLQDVCEALNIHRGVQVLVTESRHNGQKELGGEAM